MESKLTASKQLLKDFNTKTAGRVCQEYAYQLYEQTNFVIGHQKVESDWQAKTKVGAHLHPKIRIDCADGRTNNNTWEPAIWRLAEYIYHS